MEKYNKSIGGAGEEAAAKYLRRKGYKILERNYHIRGGELDIIAQKDGYIVFVEVKTRSNNGYGGGLYAVTPTKQQRLLKAAACYLLGWGDVPARFDVIAVDGHFDGKRLHVSNLEHIENAF